jgi:organic hydroperoxide reductase OsmC/OhrA
MELIWDKERSAIVTAPSGASITVGDTSDFAPEDLVAAAAAGCLMRTFLARAQAHGASVLSYASASYVGSTRPGSAPRVEIRCYVVTAEETSQLEIERLLSESILDAPVCRMLDGRIDCRADVRRLCGACAR